jgi:O-acetyl-ADP-ribose deacetylase (regulator of RNase III)
MVETRSKANKSSAQASSEADEETDNPANLTYKTGDITAATEEYIVHQCNCQSTSGAGLAATIIKTFPYADPYSNRRPNPKSPSRCLPADESKPGTIQVWRPPEDAPNSPAFIGLYAQYRPGKPSPQDSKTDREGWFRRCLDLLEKVPGLTSLAMPWKIGCGLGGGDWGVYEGMIREWAEGHPDIAVTIYKLEESHGGRGRGRGRRRGRGGGS